MTKKQMISTLKGFTFGTLVGSKGVEALDMAISAHEQQSCEDVVSRQAVLDLATTIQTDDYSGNEILKVVDVDDVKALPPVTPQQKHEDVAKAFQLGVAFGFGEKHDEMDKVIEEVKKVIEPKPKTGRWIDDGFYADGWSHKAFHCSECGHNILGFKADLKIECPNCGARMVEPQESNTEKHKPCVNYEDGCEEWAGCPCIRYKTEDEPQESEE